MGIVPAMSSGLVVLPRGRQRPGPEVVESREELSGLPLWQNPMVVLKKSDWEPIFLE